jgi:hypothetical protein
LLLIDDLTSSGAAEYMAALADVYLRLPSYDVSRERRAEARGVSAAGLIVGSSFGQYSEIREALRWSTCCTRKNE